MISKEQFLIYLSHEVKCAQLSASFYCDRSKKSLSSRDKDFALYYDGFCDAINKIYTLAKECDFK